MVLPPDLRAGATVVSYDKATGARTVLRQGTNFIECQPRMDDGFTRCYNKVIAPRRDLEGSGKRAEKENGQRRFRRRVSLPPRSRRARAQRRRATA